MTITLYKRGSIVVLPAWNRFGRNFVSTVNCGRNIVKVDSKKKDEQVMPASSVQTPHVEPELFGPVKC